MAFRNSILAGEELVRSGIRSENYEAGVAGWRISRNGDAEFNDITARGTVRTANPPARRIEISSTAGFENAIQFFTGDVDELAAGRLEVYTEPDGADGTGPRMRFINPVFFNRPFVGPASITLTNNPGGATPADSRITLDCTDAFIEALRVTVAGVRDEPTNWADITGTTAFTLFVAGAGGEVKAEARRSGRRCEVRWWADFGAGGGFAAGTPTITLPAAAPWDFTAANRGGTWVGACWMLEGGVRHWVGSAFISDGGRTLNLVHTEAGNAGLVNFANPFPWGNTDSLAGYIAYDLATAP